MFRSVAAFEWRYQLRSPAFWVGSLIFFLMAFGATASDYVQLGSIGSVHKNSPYALLVSMTTLGVFGIFIVVAMVAGVVVRDDDTNFSPIIRSTPVGKASYLGGRFCGASAAALVVLAMVPLGILVGSWMPWVDPEKLGPLRPWDYLYTLFAFGLPTLLITSATFFAVATATRSLLWCNVTAVALLVCFLVGRGAVRADPAWEPLAAVVDPFGLSALQFATKYWTATERNAQLPALAGLVLVNRALWAGGAALVFAAAYRAFRFEMRFDARPAAAHPPTAAPGRRRSARAERAARQHERELAAMREVNPAGLRGVMAADARRPLLALPRIPPATAATTRAQLMELCRIEMALAISSAVADGPQ